MSPMASKLPAGLRRSGILIDSSRVMLGLCLLLIAATFLLISPQPGQEYPGSRPWRQNSALRWLVGCMSLGGWVQTPRGVEIKDFAFHLAAAAGLALLALRGALAGRGGVVRRGLHGPWTYAPAFLGGWAALSLLSSLWSTDAQTALGQGILYALAICWAVAVAWTLRGRDIATLLGGVVAGSSLAGVLCVWYYYERNPFHRPGFPIGNPNTLAASIAPAALIAASVLLGHGWSWLRGRRAQAWLPAAAAALALVPLCWVLFLTYSRAAIVGLLAGLIAVFLAQVGRRVRWVVLVLGLTLASAAGGWWLYSSQRGAAMARDATVRFRLSTWRYAAELWQIRPVSGMGAGSYTRLANQLSIRDRFLDPAAFMGDWVEHAHNELFEVLAEIGLVGGTTFLAGYVASLLAGLALLRANLSDERRWLLVGLLAGLVALMVDALFGVGLRLPGVPAIFYTLLGTLWAACRATVGRPRPALSPDTGRRSAGARRWLVSVGIPVVSAGLAVACGWVALRNWSGVLHEQRAEAALRGGDYRSALASALVARERLLDPIRVLASEEVAVRARLEMAQAALAELAGREEAAETRASSLPGSVADRQSLIAQFSETFAAAAQLNRRAPTFRRMAAIGARCAESLAALYAEADPGQAAQWREEAKQAWRIQRLQTPCDVETLLALCRYPASTAYYVGLLRDALRAGLPPPEWRAALHEATRLPGFEATLEAFLLAAAPFDPQSDLDSIIGSMAPEAYRLVAAWRAMRGESAAAVPLVAQAVRLYGPMRTRFPAVQSAALAEQAEYAFRVSPQDAREALDLIEQAIRGLPPIQTQKFEEQASPLRLRQARYLLSGGHHQAALAVVRTVLGDAAAPPALAELYLGLAETFIRDPPDSRPPVEAWLWAAVRQQPDLMRAWGWLAWLAAERGDLAGVEATLRDASGAGVGEQDQSRIRSSLCEEFPSLCEQLRGR